MSIKNDLLKKINKDAQKIRERRVEAANNKTLEAAVFEFFKNIEQAKFLNEGRLYNPEIFSRAKQSLDQRIRSFDRGAKTSIEFNVSDDLLSWEQQEVRGVTIWWSQTHITKNQCEPSMYIDLTEMLLS